MFRIRQSRLIQLMKLRYATQETVQHVWVSLELIVERQGSIMLPRIPSYSILSQINPFHITTPETSKIRWNILLSMPRSLKLCFPLTLSPRNIHSYWMIMHAPFVVPWPTALRGNGVCLHTRANCLTLGVASRKHGLMSFGLLHYTVTEQCTTTIQLHGAGPLPPGAARELRLDVCRGCWVWGRGCSISCCHCVCLL